MQVFAFGHSITHGFWDEEGGWVSRLRKFLDRKSLEKPEEYYFETYNLGVPGNTSEDLLERFEQELEARIWEEDETVIVIQIGANDIQYLEDRDRINVPKDEYRGNLEELVDQALEYTSNVLLIGELYTTIEGPIPWSEDRHLDDERLEEYVEIQREVSEEKDVPLIDLRSEKSKQEWSDMLEDGSHPDSKGHESIEQKVRSKLLEENMLGIQ